MLVGYSNIYTD